MASGIDYETINYGINYIDQAIERLETILSKLNVTLIDDDNTSIATFKSFASQTLEDLRTVRGKLVSSANSAKAKETEITG